MNNNYYKAPEERIFQEVKGQCIDLWNVISDDEGYVEEKVSRIRDVKNVEDNMMFFIAMFDLGNQWKLKKKLSEDAKAVILERLAPYNDPYALMIWQ